MAVAVVVTRLGGALSSSWAEVYRRVLAVTQHCKPQSGALEEAKSSKVYDRLLVILCCKLVSLLGASTRKKKFVEHFINNCSWLWWFSSDWIVALQSADRDRGTRFPLLRSEASAFRALLLASLPSDSGIYC